MEPRDCEDAREGGGGPVELVDIKVEVKEDVEIKEEKRKTPAVSTVASSGTSGVINGQQTLLTPTTGQRMSGRFIKRPRKDDEQQILHLTNGQLSSPKVCARRLQHDISSPKTSLDKNILNGPTAVERTRRSWDLWTQESKNWFFEALCEFGKDFDSIHTAMASKYKKSKQHSDLTFKNKDQVRQFYYRTWNKVTKALGGIGEKVKKSVQEIYGLVNYSEMRKKIGGKVLNPTNAPRLLELVTTGQTMVKIKGKNLRIKTPVCRALRLVNNVPHKFNDGPKVPTHISIEMRPLDNSTWTHVQSLAQNPRVKVHCPPQRRFSSVIEMMQTRWQPSNTRKKSSLLAALESLETPQELKNSIFQFAGPKKITLRVFPNKQPQAVAFTLADTYNSSDVCLNAYMAKFAVKAPNNDSPETVCPSGQEVFKHEIPETTKSDDDSKKPTHHTGQHSSKERITCDNNLFASCSTVAAGVTKREKKNSFSLMDHRDRNDFTGVSDALDSTVAAIASEEANDALHLFSSYTNSCTSTSTLLPSLQSDKDERVDGPVGSGWTVDSLDIMTVGDLYLQLACPSSIVLYYTFEGTDFPAPESRFKSLIDRLITVLSSTIVDKKAPLATQVKQCVPHTPPPTAPIAPPTAPPSTGPPCAPHANTPMVQHAKPKRERLSQRAARDHPSEFAVPQGLAPRAINHKTSNGNRMEALKIELSIPSNRRQRFRKKPITAAVVQRPLLPRSDPHLPNHASSGAVAPHTNTMLSSMAPQIVPAKAVEASITDCQFQSQQVEPAPLGVITELSLEGFTPSNLMGSSSLTNESLQLSNRLKEELQSVDLVHLPTPARNDSGQRGLSESILETPKKSTLFNFGLEPPSLNSSFDLSASLLATPTKQWLHGETSNISLGTLLNSLDSPLKTPPHPSNAPTAVGADSNSNLEAKLPDVDSHLQSLMNESSLDYMTKFADLAAQINRQATGGNDQ